MVQITASCIAALYHFQYFNNEEKGHFTFGIFYLFLLVTGIMASVYGTSSIFPSKNAVKFFSSLLIILIVIALLARSETYHHEHIQKILRHLSNQ